MSLDIKVTQLNLIAHWDICDQSSNMCQLCRRPLVSPSLQELSSTKGKVLGQLVKGKCQHIFHTECMNDLINSGCQLCPIDKTPWDLQLRIKSGALYQEQETMAFKSVSK
jgi:hypothetical protein